MDTVTRVQIVDEAVCISQRADPFGKGIHNYFPSSDG